MPTRHDEADAMRYAMETESSFERIRETFDEYNPFSYIAEAIKSVGTDSNDLASAISQFMSQLNKEYFEDDPIEEVSFDEAMGFNREEV